MSWHPQIVSHLILIFASVHSGFLHKHSRTSGRVVSIFLYLYLSLYPFLCRWHSPYTHSCGSSQAPPTAPYPGRPGRWRCRSSRSGSPPAGSAETRRSSAEEKHTITGRRTTSKIPVALQGGPPAWPPCPQMVSLKEMPLGTPIKRPNSILEY